MAPLSLTEVSWLLAGISDGEKRWHIATTQDDYLSGDSHVMITYTNPIYPGLPNELSYYFPLLRDPDRKSDMALVYLHPEEAIMGQYGLYFEDGELKEDVLLDWEVFWSPIEFALNLRVTSPTEYIRLIGKIS